MPRAIVFVLLSLVLVPLGAQSLVSTPQWTLKGPLGSVGPGQEITVEAEVRLPPGYYQDAESPFLVFEPLPPARVVGRSSSDPTLRAGHSSFTGTFRLFRTVVLPSDTPPGSHTLTWNLGWQICLVDGVCLLPAQSQASLTVVVGQSASTGPGFDFWAALVGAFLGGLLLNVMPCVFPVLALKTVRLLSSDPRPRVRRLEALASASGTFGAVLGLGLVTAAVAGLGQRLEWGVLFQQPAFIGVLVLVFVALTLQLWGLWSWAPPSRKQGRPGVVSAVANGAFLVIAAAPCTAPLLGPALGFALARPAAEIPLFFGAIGLGFALPLLLLAWMPGWGRLLPRPGPWLVVVERVAGAFLAATVVYLVWILLVQTGPDRLAAVLLALVAWAGCLALGRRGRNPILRRGVQTVLGLTVLVGSFLILAPGVPHQNPIRAGWSPFTSAALAQARDSGRPVLVDATAAWCATCQVNEAAVLGRPDVEAEMDRLGMVRLRADYTRPDPEIRQWLASVNRAGLPVYALYVPGHEVWLFPELLTDTNFTHALAPLVGR